MHVDADDVDLMYVEVDDVVDLMSFSPRSWSPSESNILKAHSARTVGGVATLSNKQIWIQNLWLPLQMEKFSVSNIFIGFDFIVVSSDIVDNHGSKWERRFGHWWSKEKKSTSIRWKRGLNLREESMSRNSSKVISSPGFDEKTSQIRFANGFTW